MKNSPLMNLILKRKFVYHAMIFVFAAIVPSLFLLFRHNLNFWQFFIATFCLIVFQLEIFIWLGTKYFSFIPGKDIKELTKNVILKFILFYLSCFFVAALLFICMSAILHLINGNNMSTFWQFFIQHESKGFLITTNLGLMLGAILFFFFQWQDAIRREQKLKEEKLIFQYETLKNQVNPHFLFNCLNTLSSLVNSKPSLADSFINKLSSIYRYVLENKDVELVNLNSEIEFAKDYFFLQQIRDEDKINMTIDADGQKGYLILPISLQILIENALKHNSATRNKPLQINVYFKEVDYIVVENTLQRKSIIEKSSKIGLKNLAERIKLATGREMRVEQSDQKFTVKIPLMPV